MTTAATTHGALARRGWIGARALFERQMKVYRHGWAEVVAAVLEPLMYLLAMGVGVGHLVGNVPGVRSDVTFAQYIAPALLAMAVMNASTNETIFGAFGRIKQTNLYDVVLATPVDVREIVLAEVLWATTRGTLAGVGFLAIMAALGLTLSWNALLILPMSVLIAIAFAPAGLIVASYVRGVDDFQYVQLVMLPMFLFATTFYPLSVYPRAIQVLVVALPLYHSINVVRGPSLGTVGSDVVIGVAFLVGMTVVSWWFALRRMRHVLIH